MRDADGEGFEGAWDQGVVGPAAALVAGQQPRTDKDLQVVGNGALAGAGSRASSTALVGFGLDSVIEVSSAAAVAWQFAGRDPEAREKVALRIIAFSFFGLAAFVTIDALRSLLGTGEAQHSTVGLVLAALSLAIMPCSAMANAAPAESSAPYRRCCSSASV